MQNRKRIINILIAGTLTALLLTVVLAFRGGNEAVAQAGDNAAQVATVEMVGNYETDIAALQAQVDSLQEQNAAYAAQNEELRAAVTTLQAREDEYQAQIETANQTIDELAAQSGSLAFGAQVFGEGQRPPHEHDH